MALVNPNIAMSYRPTVEYQPRNALAEAAQIQQIMGGQRQAEMADMQMEDLRRERDALGRIQAAIVAKGGPPDLGAAADEMIKTGRPQFVNQGMAIRESLKKQRYFEEFESRYGAGRAAPNAAAAGSNAMATPAAAVPAAAAPSVLAPAAEPSVAGALTNFERTPPKYSKSIFGTLPGSSEEILNSNPEAKRLYELYSMNMSLALNSDPDSRDYRGGVQLASEQAKRLSELGIKLPENIDQAREVLGIRQPASAAANALAPAAAPVTNAMLAPAAQPAMPPAGVQLASAGAGPNIDDLMMRYDLAAKAGHPMAPAILKQIEAALRADPSELRTMQQLGYPLTQEGYASFRAAQMREQAPPALVPILQNGRPVLVPREQAVGQTPFSPASVQVLGMGPAAREPAARESAAKPPTGYRFTATGDLEPIPGGPASPGLSPKDIQKREAVYPQATQSVNGFTTKSDQFIAELERLRDDPGLNQITGPIYGRTPSVSRAGSRAQALYDKIFAKGGFQALQDMREASKTGGALGNVSNEEGRRLEKSIVGGLDRTQNIADVQQGINDLIAEIRVSQARVREAYDTTYEYRTQRGAGGGDSAPAAGAARQLSPQDKQALDWANSNPTDPRAAQIKARLGVRQ